jgi:hypothetical protein
MHRWFRIQNKNIIRRAALHHTFIIMNGFNLLRGLLSPTTA